MKLFFKKTMLFALVAALGLASLPHVNVFAAGHTLANAYDATPPPQIQITNDRLELIWARQLRIYERLGRVDGLTEKVQRLRSPSTKASKASSTRIRDSTRMAK